MESTYLLLLFIIFRCLLLIGTHYTTFVRYYQERNYSTIPFKSRNVLIDFQILPLLLPCSMILSGTLRKHTEPLHFTLTNNVYFPEVSLTLSILYQWTRNIDLITFSEDFEHGENYSSQVLRNEITIFGIIFTSIWIHFSCHEYIFWYIFS